MIDGECQIDLSLVRRLIVVGAGKASAALATALHQQIFQHLPRGSPEVVGWINVPEGTFEEQLPGIRLFSARPSGLNIPTQAAIEGTRQILRLVSTASRQDVVLCLLSGGGSALLVAPQSGISLAEKQAVARHIAAAGGDIRQLNAVRQSLSQVKGGGLARACTAGRLISLILSDVLGDPLEWIASGPTVIHNAPPLESWQSTDNPQNPQTTRTANAGGRQLVESWNTRETTAGDTAQTAGDTAQTAGDTAQTPGDTAQTSGIGVDAEQLGTKPGNLRVLGCVGKDPGVKGLAEGANRDGSDEDSEHDGKTIQSWQPAQNGHSTQNKHSSDSAQNGHTRDIARSDYKEQGGRSAGLRSFDCRAQRSLALSVLHGLGLLRHPELQSVTRWLTQSPRVSVADSPLPSIQNILLGNNSDAVDAAGVRAVELGYSYCMQSARQPERDVLEVAHQVIHSIGSLLEHQAPDASRTWRWQRRAKPTAKSMRVGRAGTLWLARAAVRL